MITKELINPQSIVVVGASNDISKPGGKVLKNLIDNNYKGKLMVSNPKEDIIQGINCYKNITDLPQTDLAILAIAAKYCPEAVEILAKEKGTKAFIILSAGFSEESHEGAEIENKIVKTITETGGCLIGPNCIGMMNPNHTSVFTTPIPKLGNKGVDLISGSGATALFIMDAAIPKGITFSNIYSVGNSAQMGVEDILKYMDETFDPEKDAKVKLLYVESIKKPQLLLKHASSLIRKGCKIAAIKSGSSSAGSRAASSHTGALASSDVAVDSLLKKAGIVRCIGREELVTVASIFMHHELKGKNIAIITHAGGPAVMLTDVLSNGGLEIPKIEGAKAEELLSKLYAGSSVANPIDFLATGTAQHLGDIIDACDNDFNNIDGMAVIFGSPGLFEIFDVYKVLSDKIKTSKKPIYPILPSHTIVKKEIEYFTSLGNTNFPDEIAFGNALCKVFFTPKPEEEYIPQYDVDKVKIREIINSSEDGYISPDKIQQLLDAAEIPRAGEAVVTDKKEAVKEAEKLGYPIVMKVVGPVHKSDVGGVVLNVKNSQTVEAEFERMIKIKDTTAILLQPMLSGIELFAGAKEEPGFGHMVLCGLGGIFIEVLKDISVGLVPISLSKADTMIKSLKSYKIIQGVRGQEGVNEKIFSEIIYKLSSLLEVAPEIKELDLNPLLGKKDKVVAVDARIRIEKNN